MHRGHRQPAGVSHLTRLPTFLLILEIVQSTNIEVHEFQEVLCSASSPLPPPKAGPGSPPWLAAWQHTGWPSGINQPWLTPIRNAPSPTGMIQQVNSVL